jgi:hypothetical protein
VLILQATMSVSVVLSCHVLSCCRAAVPRRRASPQDHWSKTRGAGYFGRPDPLN